MKTNHMMIDLETLGLGVDAVVLTAGITIFSQDLETGKNELTIEGSMAYRLDILEQLLAGRTVDKSTQEWWASQRDLNLKAFDAIRTGETLAPTMVLGSISAQYRGNNCQTLWANGTDFDIGVLKSMFKMFRMTPPWAYNAVRDARTVYKLFDKPELAKIKPEVEHDAVEDCIAQVKKLSAVGLVIK